MATHERSTICEHFVEVHRKLKLVTAEDIQNSYFSCASAPLRLILWLIQQSFIPAAVLRRRFCSSDRPDACRPTLRWPCATTMWRPAACANQSLSASTIILISIWNGWVLAAT